MKKLSVFLLCLLALFAAGCGAEEQGTISGDLGASQNTTAPPSAPDSGESGAVERDIQMNSHFPARGLTGDEAPGYSVTPWLYTYQDDSRDISVTIEYPQIYSENVELTAAVNACLREAFFYHYYTEDDGWNPGRWTRTEITRQYLITRADERYLSVRVREDNYAQGANHPNEWETGVTIDMETGERAMLADLFEKDVTLTELLDSGAFTCLWTWEGDSGGESWLAEIRTQAAEKPLDDYDGQFYLTADSLGLITTCGRYYTCIEAGFSDLEPVRE